MAVKKFVMFLTIIVIANLGCAGSKQPAVFSVDPALRPLKVGSQFKYSVSQFDVEGRKTNYPVTFKSANPKIAAVDKNGTVNGKRSGSTQIKITCADKSFTVKVDVLEELYSMHLPEEGIIADNGVILLHDVGGIHNAGYVVNNFGDGKGYSQTMFSIKNISDQNILIDPDHFIMVGREKEIATSSNSRITNKRYKGILRKQLLAPRQTIEKLVLFTRPHVNFNMNEALIIYNDGKNPKVIDKIGR